MSDQNTSPLESLRQIRIQKMRTLEDANLPVFPSRLRGSRTSVSTAKGLGIDHKLTLAGRIISKREMGKIAFLILSEESGKIQLLVRPDELDADSRLTFDNLDIGDIVESSGVTMNSKTGEFSLGVTSLRIISKSLRPLPEKWHGLQDIEERSRRRYVDLIMNEESRRIFKIRSQVLTLIRKFLIEERDYMEVECPVLQPLYGGTRARPFTTHHNSLDQDLYLRISNELYLKRLIVGGFERVFEMGHTFRNEGMDRNHNPEFTMLETMHAYADYKFNMELIEDMFEYVVMHIFGTTHVEYQGQMLEFKAPWPRVKLVELFKEHTGVEFSSVSNIEEAVELAKKFGVKAEKYMSVQEVLLEIFETICVKHVVTPTFIYDYPADFYPLAKRIADNPEFVESFDIYVCGMEMGTNYSEQNDPFELRKAWEKEGDKEALGHEETHKTDEDFIEAMEFAMPPTSGIGPGIDRWIMILTDSHHLRDVILFPTMKS